MMSAGARTTGIYICTRAVIKRMFYFMVCAGARTIEIYNCTRTCHKVEVSRSKRIERLEFLYSNMHHFMTGLRTVVNFYSTGTRAHHKVESALYDSARTCVNSCSTGILGHPGLNLAGEWCGVGLWLHQRHYCTFDAVDGEWHSPCLHIWDVSQQVLILAWAHL